MTAYTTEGPRPGRRGPSAVCRAVSGVVSRGLPGGAFRAEGFGAGGLPGGGPSGGQALALDAPVRGPFDRELGGYVAAPVVARPQRTDM